MTNTMCKPGTGRLLGESPLAPSRSILAPVLPKRIVSAGDALDSSTGEASKNERDVLAAETKAVRKRNIHLLATGHVGYVVQVAVGIGMIEIDRRRQHAVADCQQANDCFDAASRGDQVPHHALGTRDRHFKGRFSKGPL